MKTLLTLILFIPLYCAGQLNIINATVSIKNDGRLIVMNGDPTAIKYSSDGYIDSEGEDNLVVWHITSGVAGNYVVPFGKSSDKNLPVTYVKNNANDVGTVHFSTYGTASDNLPMPTGVTNISAISGISDGSNIVDRYWIIAGSDAALDKTLILTYSHSELDGLTESSLLAQYWTGITWYLPALGTTNDVLNTSTITNINPHKVWVLTTDINHLPIELGEFYGHCDETQIIKWNTLSESMCMSFEILASNDALNWIKLDEIPGQGNSNSLVEYTFKNEGKDYNYFKLKQNDFDGKYKTFGPIYVENCHSEDECKIYPNPFDAIFSIECNCQIKLVKIFDATGKLLYNEKLENEQTMNFQKTLSSGTYYVEITTSDDTVYSYTVIKK